MDNIFLILVIILLSCLAFSLVRLHSLMWFTLIASTISMFSTVLYIMNDALDVAFTEAAVGAGISTILMILIIHLTKGYSIYQVNVNTNNNTNTRYTFKSVRKYVNILLLLLLAIIILDSIAYLPEFGSLNNPTNNDLYLFYINSYHQIAIPNMVTIILGAFRGFDTMGETLVIFVAALGTYLILKTSSSLPSTAPKNIKEDTLPTENISDSNNEFAVKNSMISNNNSKKNKYNYSLKNSLINADILLSSTLFLLMPVISLFGVYVQLNGDSGPGGAFQAGVILSANYIMVAIFLGYKIATMYLSTRMIINILTLGALIYVFTAIITVFLGGYLLDYHVFSKDFTHAYHYGILSIETGVCCTVFAAMCLIIGQFYSKIKISTISLKKDTDEG